MDVRVLRKDVWPYQMVIKMPDTQSINELDTIDKWCSTNLGHRFVNWYGYGLRNGIRMYAFKDEATLLVFKLVWGNYGNR